MVDISARIDDRTAWNLVRAVPCGLNGGGSSVRVHDGPRSNVWLEVEPSGEWATSTLLTDDAKDLIELYLPLQLHADLTVAQIGQSLDGRIATENGHSHYVTGPADICHLHRLRALVDVVVVGAGTIASDNPRLTVRDVEGDNPVRVVLDPNGRLGPDHHIFTDGSAPSLVFRRQGDNSTSGGQQSPSNVLMVTADANGSFDPKVIIQILRDLGHRRILVEGGGITISRFLKAGALDRLHVTVAPLLIGSGRSALSLDPILSLQQALRPQYRHFRLGDDILFDLDFRSKDRE